MIVSLYPGFLRFREQSVKKQRKTGFFKNRFCFAANCVIIPAALIAEGGVRLKTVGRLILSAIFAVLTGLCMAVAKSAPDAVFGFYTDFSARLQARIASVTGRLPFPLWQILAVLLLLWLVYTLIRAISRVRIVGWLSGVLLAACVLAFAFVGLWGLNHFNVPLGQRLGLQTGSCSRQELFDASVYYAQQAGSLADRMPRNVEGCTVCAPFETLAAGADTGYEKLAEEYPFFGGGAHTVKKLLAGGLFSKMGSTGVYICFTAEPCVNPDTYPVWLPFTMCHELAHGKSIAAEDEANFCAYLACMQSDDVQFRYSGAIAALTYCGNALHQADPAAWEQLWEQVHPGVVRDLSAADAHYAQYEGRVQDAAQQVNDLYLRAFEETGVQSYGEAAELLVAWYLQNRT